MAKTITAMLIGIAAADGAIKSIDDEVATYVTGIAGTEYGKTPIRALLHMSSGVEFKETYDGQDDVARLGRDLFGQPGKDPWSASRSSTLASRRPIRNGTTQVPRPRSLGSSCVG